MDVVHFLKERTSFIRFFYDESSRPFRDIQQNIESEQPPFDNPPYSEDSEPPFLVEYFQADTGISILGMSCVSLLSDTLKIYFYTLQSRVIGFSLSRNAKAIAKKQGFVAAYKHALGHILETDWNECPVRFDVIEQVVLARNSAQHGSTLVSFDVYHDEKALEKHPRPFFVSDTDLQVCAENNISAKRLFPIRIEISRETLFSAINEVENLADWIEGRMDRAWK